MPVVRALPGHADAGVGPGAVAERGEGRVAGGARLGGPADRPGLPVVAGEADGEVAAAAGGRRVAEQQPGGARVGGGDVGREAGDGAVVGGVGEFGVLLEGGVGDAAVGGVGHRAVGRGAVVEQDAAVGQLHGLVLVAAGSDRCAHLPGGAVVVAVGADGVVGAVVPDGVLLDQAALVGAVAQLDAFAGGGEHAGPGGVLDVGGDPFVPPGEAVVVGVAVVGLEDVGVVLVVAGGGAEEALVHGGRVEDEDPPGLPVDQEAGVAVPLGRGVLADDLLGLPGGAAVGAAPQDDPEVAGQVGEGGAGVVGGEQGALGGPGQGGDAVVGRAGAGGGDVLRGEVGGGALGGGDGGGEQSEGRGEYGQEGAALHGRTSSRWADQASWASYGASGAPAVAGPGADSSSRTQVSCARRWWAPPPSCPLNS